MTVAQGRGFQKLSLAIDPFSPMKSVAEAPNIKQVKANLLLKHGNQFSRISPGGLSTDSQQAGRPTTVPVVSPLPFYVSCLGRQGSS